MTTPSEALKSPNIRAFLYALRFGEGTAGPDGYRTMFGGGLFDNNFADHPRKAITKSLGGKPITSTAAGAYQFLSRTWDEMAKKYKLPDFSPTSQDLAAVGLLIRRGALPSILAGRVDSAVLATNKEWASLPGSPYGQPTVTLAKFTKHYTDAGGSLQPQPIPEGEPPVAPFLLAALPALLDAVPKLTEIFGNKTEKAEQNTKAVEIAVGVAKAALGASNEQDLVEKLKSDPGAAVIVREAVEGQWYSIIDAAGAKDARKADLEVMQSKISLLYSPSFVIGLALLPLAYIIVGSVAGLWGTAFSEDVRSALAASVISLIIGGLAGYYYGTTTSTNKPPVK